MKKPVKAKVKTYKPKVCAQCEETLTPTRNLQKVCGPRCAIDYSRAQKAKKAEQESRANLKIRKKALQLRGYFVSKAQTAFNAFIRERDEGKPCPSCGRTYHPPMIFGGQWDCGHFMGLVLVLNCVLKRRTPTDNAKPVTVDQVGSLQRIPPYTLATVKR